MHLHMLKKCRLVLSAASKDFLKKKCFNLAGAISFFSILSAMPFIFLAISIFGVVLGASGEILDGIRMFFRLFSPQVTDFFLNELAYISRYGGSLSWFGSLFLVWAATLVFHSIKAAFDAIFETHSEESFFKDVFYSLLMIPVLGALPFCAVLIIAALNFMNQIQLRIGIGSSYLTFLIIDLAVGHIVPILLMVILFTSIYKWVPAAKIKLKHALLGGLAGTFLWEIVIRMFIYFAFATETYGIIFGSFKTAIIVLVSFYYSACVLLFCGEIVAQLSQKRSQYECP